MLKLVKIHKTPFLRNAASSYKTAVEIVSYCTMHADDWEADYIHECLLVVCDGCQQLSIMFSWKSTMRELI